jgi:hypothetical protein
MVFFCLHDILLIICILFFLHTLVNIRIYSRNMIHIMLREDTRSNLFSGLRTK